MENRKALLVAWVEGEGERQCRPVPPLSAANDPDPRGWVRVGVCALAGALTVAFLACWLVKVWGLASRLGTAEQLHLEGLRLAVGDPNKSAWWKEDGPATRSNSGTFGTVLIFRVLAVGFGTVVGGLFLRAGCILHNKLAGGQRSPRSVPIPGLGKAMCVTFVTAVVSAVGGVDPLSILTSFLIMSAMIAALLPTTFTRGLLLTLCYLLVGAVVVGVLAMIFGGIGLLLAPRR